MSPYYQDEFVTIWHGDCRDVLPHLEGCTACVTDPPYGLEFMGKDWDRLGDIGKASHAGPTDGADSDAAPGQRFRVNYNAAGNRRCLSCGHWEWSGSPCRCDSPLWPNVKAHQGAIMQEWFREHFAAILPALLPGAPLLAFGGTRTHHRLMCGIEDAGFELRDCLMYLYGAGFPKSHNFGCKCGGNAVAPSGRAVCETCGGVLAFAGYGSALKPAYEPVILAMKPLGGTFAANALEHGVAGLNVDGARIEAKGRPKVVAPGDGFGGRSSIDMGSGYQDGTTDQGRWPANLALDTDAAALLDEMSGELHTHPGTARRDYEGAIWGKAAIRKGRVISIESSGGASRFYYTSKAHTSERWVTWSCDCETPEPSEWVKEGRSRSGRTGTTSPPRDTSEATLTGECDSSTESSGSEPTDRSPQGGSSTTSTATNSIADSKTSDSSPRQSTSESTPGANSETGSGGSPADDAEPSSRSTPSTSTSRARVGRSTGVVVPATSGSSWNKSVCVRCGSKVRSEGHPTVKPSDLMKWLVTLVRMPERNLILDPFAGSGTTGFACKELAIPCVLIEQDEANCETAAKRLVQGVLAL